ncbi:hypothetical protein V8C34DRAFT_289607 [Trichoderma compactum]
MQKIHKNSFTAGKSNAQRANGGGAHSTQHTAHSTQHSSRGEGTIRYDGCCSLCIRNIELRLHLLRTLVQITPSVPAPCKQKQLPIKSRAGSQALGHACRLRGNMEYRVGTSLKARRSNVAVTSKWKLPNKFSVRVMMLLYCAATSRYYRKVLTVGT